MTVHIVITGHEAGKTWMYERAGKQGTKKLVSTYYANIERANRVLFLFAVTRDSANVVFGKHTKRFLKNGECPPSRMCNPYYAKHQDAPRNGNCLLLYERVDTKYLLYGTKRVKRTSILIHAAPASSLGCFGVAGGAQGFKEFWREICGATSNFTDQYDVRVYVEPRPNSHHTRLLVR